MSSEKLRLWDSTVPIVGRYFGRDYPFETTFTIAKPLVYEKLGLCALSFHSTADHMRGRFGTGAIALWGFALNVALQKGWLDWCPDWGVALMLAIPIMTWAGIGLTHDTVRKYLHRTNRIVAIGVFILVGALIGGAGGGVIYALMRRSPVKPSTDVVVKETAATPAPSSPEVSTLAEEVKQLREAIVQSPSVDHSAKIAVLKAESDRISKKREELTEPEKDTFDLTLKSLEEGRQRYLADKKLQDRQQEITAQRETIETDKANKDAEKALELDEIDFARRSNPILDDAITTFYKMLRQASQGSVETIFTDFPNSDRPSIYGSKMLNDGKIVGGEQIISVGSSKEWEFHLIVAGPPNRRQRSLWGRHLDLEIKAGSATATIKSFPPLPPSNPPQLRLTLSVGRFQEDCLLTEYQKPMERLFHALIKHCYNVAPLTAKP